jgi:hypothetical protein
MEVGLLLSELENQEPLWPLILLSMILKRNNLNSTFFHHVKMFLNSLKEKMKDMKKSSSISKKMKHLKKSNLLRIACF